MISKAWQKYIYWFDGRFYLLEDPIRGNKGFWEIEIDEDTFVNILTDGHRCQNLYSKKEHNYFEVSVSYETEDSDNFVTHTLLYVPYYVVLEIIEGLKESL